MHDHFWLFAALLLAGELMPIRGLRRARDHGVTVSTTFSFAILITAGAGPAVVIESAASLIDDIIHGKSARTALFEVGHYTLSLAGAGAVLALAGVPSAAPPTSALLLGLAPIHVVSADFSFALLPFLVLPLVAIYQNRRQVAVNEHQALHDALTGFPTACCSTSSWNRAPEWPAGAARPPC